MRVDIKIKVLIIAVFLLAANLLLVDFSEANSSVNFSQSILPVKFVYLDGKGGIKNIWSNVTEKDSLYIVKFLDEKNKTEVRTSENLMGNYQKIARTEKSFYSGNAGQCSFDCLAIDFVKSGEVLEEVHTVV